ncbi:uncharacterized protein LOC102805997 [Saccoglossus kowalevskii]|uniref:Uncharacterized protein LOC102805997 n=1 Tax=Saccoglossus kowalevskii TaxID=10224 RepID=A0ABM0MYR4_SACKO|nr:PREDICTED: uncharacterized protein LOC102805997 [Saccoglossus kowalevskii]
MTIEQSLMRSGKTQGELINITHQESARTKWLLSAHIMAQYTEALRSLTGTFTGTWSEQHREFHPGNIQRDAADLAKFEAFLLEHNPFTVEDEDELRNVATGLIADYRVNVDDSLQIGQNIHAKLTGKTVAEVIMKKVDQAKTFAVLRKLIKVEKEDIAMSSAELYQRLLSVAYLNGLPQPSVFAHELATVSPAFFQDDGSMRKS